MISLLQDLSRNINNIRLYNNQIFKTNKIDKNRINILSDEKQSYIFIPENMCLFQSTLIIDNIENIQNDPLIQQAIRIGLIPLVESKINEVNLENKWSKIGIHFFLTSKCNMTCDYCVFSKKNVYSKYTDEFSFEEIVNVIQPQEIDFTFTGGEPFLEFKRMQMLVNFIKNFCKNKKISFSFQVTTNGTILTKQMLLFLVENKIKVTISVDGNRDWYNKTYNENIFNIIMHNFNILKKFCICNIHMTIEKEPVNLEERLLFLYGLTPNNLIVSPDILNPISNDTIEKIIEIDKHQILSQNKMINYSFKRIFNIINNFEYHDFGCGAGKNLFAINNHGKIIPCSYFHGIEKQTFNSMETLNQHNTSISVNKNIVCKNCISKYICGGGCLYKQHLTDYEVINESSIKSFCLYLNTVLKYIIYNFTKIKSL